MMVLLKPHAKSRAEQSWKPQNGCFQTDIHASRGYQQAE